MKETIKQMLASEAKYDDIIEAVTEEVISQALVKTRGNQTFAAELLGMNRGTFRKYLKAIVSNNETNQKQAIPLRRNPRKREGVA